MLAWAWRSFRFSEVSRSAAACSCSMYSSSWLGSDQVMTLPPLPLSAVLTLCARGVVLKQVAHFYHLLATRHSPLATHDSPLTTQNSELRTDCLLPTGTDSPARAGW